MLCNVINYFKNINEKNLCKFIIFDIKDFYTSIKEKLLNNALQFASSVTPIKEKDKEIIHHAQKSLLFNNGEVWIKKEGKLFNITMAATFYHKSH